MRVQRLIIDIDPMPWVHAPISVKLTLTLYTDTAKMWTYSVNLPYDQMEAEFDMVIKVAKEELRKLGRV